MTHTKGLLNHMLQVLIMKMMKYYLYTRKVNLDMLDLKMNRRNDQGNQSKFAFPKSLALFCALKTIFKTADNQPISIFIAADLLASDAQNV
jgi:hypothetical protein